MYKIFVVFHKQIFDECYVQISQEILDKHFVFIAVNPAIEKIYTPGKYNVINEWSLPKLNKEIDNSVLRENTAIYHVYENNLHAGCDYIGFAQYDMIFTMKALENIQHLSPKSYLSLYPSNCDFAGNTMANGHDLVNYIIDSYNSFFFKKIKKEDLTIPLYNTYIIPVGLYEKIMPWVIFTYSNLIDKCLEYPAYKSTKYLIASIYERVMAIGIGAENLKMLNMPLAHDHNYKKLAY